MTGTAAPPPLLKLLQEDPQRVTVGVVGLGYVGLPLASIFLESGLRVVGFDRDADKIVQLQAEHCYIGSLEPSTLWMAQAEARFTATHVVADLAICDAVLLCLPTPLDDRQEPDLSAITDSLQAIAPHLMAGSLLVLESTTWPGTTDEVVVPLLAAVHGAAAIGVSIFIGYSPEREDPGRRDRHRATIPKLVAGVDPVSAELTRALYQHAFETVVPVDSVRVAEAAKLYENVFRAVNIALANEMKVVMTGMGIDVWEVIQAAATKPFGFMPFWPGPGLGGHCVPIDPFYLSWKARQFGTDSPLIHLAGEINRGMPAWVVGRAAEVLTRRGSGLAGARILLWGMAYKPEVDDLRETPSLALMHLLETAGAQVDYHDPFIPVVGATRQYPTYAGRSSVAPGANYDLFILATNHHYFTAESMLSHDVAILDTRGALPRHPLVFRA